MYEILKELNETTFIAIKETNIYILKKIGIDDVQLYNILINAKNRYVAAVYETTVIGESIYAVCEYVQGRTLEKYVKEKNVLDDAEIRKLALQICEGLSCIHSFGIVHRDITPCNIMITENGDAKIIDFGISRIQKKNISSDTQILGTQGYAAPEQFGFHQTNEKADIYAVGVIINYMKTQALPNESLAPGELGKIVGKCTEMDENNRYESAQALSADILKKSVNRFAPSNIFYSVPGFRRDKKGLTCISAVYYMFFIFMIIGVEYKGPKTIVTDYIPMIFVFLFSYFLVCNIGNWTDKFGFNRNTKKVYKILVRVAAAAVSVIIGGIIISISEHFFG